MKKWLFIMLAVLSLCGLSACGGGGTAGTSSSQPSAPTIAKVRIWLTLSNNPDAPSVTTLTPEQTVQASIWARGTTEENITFKLNLVYDDKFTTLVTGVRIEGTKAVAAGGLATPLEPGNYTFQAISGAFGEVVGSLQITVTPPALSGQPDATTFNKYFSDIGLGKLPPGGQLPMDLQQNISVFASGDEICLYGTLIQDVQTGQVSVGIYDPNAENFATPKMGFPRALSKGGFASSGPLDLPTGKYEYKVYVDDVLVAVLPFEVR